MSDIRHEVEVPQPSEVPAPFRRKVISGTRASAVRTTNKFDGHSL